MACEPHDGTGVLGWGRYRHIGGVLVLVLFAAPPSMPQALDGTEEQSPNLLYRATIPDTGDAALDVLLRASSNLIALQDRAPTDAEGLTSRIAAEPARLRPVLDSEGYWAGSIRVERKAGTPLAVEILVTPGPRYTLRRIEAGGGTIAGLDPGQPAQAEAILIAQDAALNTLRQDGHPLARIERVVTVDHAARAMDLAFTIIPGPRVDFAQPSVTGTERVNPEVVRRVAALRLAEQSYSPARLAQARADVAALGPFANVRLTPGEALDASGRLPVTVDVRERPFRAISASAAYETNFGFSVRLGWEHRNLLGGAENLRVELEANRLGSELDRTAGRAAITYRKPLPFGWAGAMVSSFALVRERLDSFDRDAAVFSIAYERRLSDRWTLSTGPTAEIGRAGPPDGILTEYQVAGWAIQARYDSTVSRLDPRSGIRAQASLAPSYSFSDGTPYLPLRLAGSTYLDLTGNGASILAMRAALGSLVNASAGNVPPSQRFYAGGGGSVRGYDFQSIGPRNARGQPLGGASLLEGSIEFRQRFGETWGGVAFVDAGAVGEKSFAPTASLRVGTGVGLRYYTAIGPIRADIAVPLIRQVGSGNFGFYIGIGHAF